MQHRRLVAPTLALLVAASPLVIAPRASAEQKAVRIDVSKLDASAPAPPPGGFHVSKTPADPPAMNEKSQIIFDLRYDRGDIFLVGTHAFELPAAQRTPRAMGRFALELYEGSALIERVRFDFPMLGAAEPEDAKTPSIAKKLRTRIGVMFPAANRGTRLELVDRATEIRWQLPWPLPTQAPAPASAPSPAPAPAHSAAPAPSARR